ncbi:MAG: rhodanese-related sulfurtransferase [Gammaproteobacteria bacterium]|nr:rhodanese-related sulfurtransferase [Gammaproteobacteria bacterium]
MQSICVAALYRFVSLDSYERLREPVLNELKKLALHGTILLAREGINGTIAGNPEKIDQFLNWLRQDTLFAGKLEGLDIKKSFSYKIPFTRTKVKLKKEIVTMGVTDIDPENSAGTYVKPADWNTLISNPEVLVVDTRNEYEVGIGTFKNAVNPHTTTFREFPAYAERAIDPDKHRKIAMFCTGGIRCEKSTAYLKSQGFDEVYHLQGGILKYLEEVSPEQSLWEGECFVFDERVSVDHGLSPGSYTPCHACRMPLSAAELESEHYVAGESCPHCFEQTTEEQRARYREREKQVRLADVRGETHRGEEADALHKQRQVAKLDEKNRQRAAQV